MARALFFAPFILVAVAIVFTVRGAKARALRPVTDRFSTLAILGFVLSFAGALPGIVLSHVALAEIKRTNDRGWGLAVAGLWVGYVGLIILVPLVVAFLGHFVTS